MKRILSAAVLVVLFACGISCADVLPPKKFDLRRIPPILPARGFTLSPAEDKLELTFRSIDYGYYRYTFELDSNKYNWTEGIYDKDGDTNSMLLDYERPEEGKTLKYILRAGWGNKQKGQDKIKWADGLFRRNVTVSNVGGIIYVIIENPLSF